MGRAGRIVALVEAELALSDRDEHGTGVLVPSRGRPRCVVVLLHHDVDLRRGMRPEVGDRPVWIGPHVEAVVRSTCEQRPSHPDG